VKVGESYIDDIKWTHRIQKCWNLYRLIYYRWLY